MEIPFISCHNLSPMLLLCLAIKMQHTMDLGFLTMSLDITYEVHCEIYLFMKILFLHLHKHYGWKILLYYNNMLTPIYYTY